MQRRLQALVRVVLQRRTCLADVRRLLLQVNQRRDDAATAPHQVRALLRPLAPVLVVRHGRGPLQALHVDHVAQGLLVLVQRAVAELDAIVRDVAGQDDLSAQDDADGDAAQQGQSLVGEAVAHLDLQHQRRDLAHDGPGRHGLHLGLNALRPSAGFARPLRGRLEHVLRKQDHLQPTFTFTFRRQPAVRVAQHSLPHAGASAHEAPGEARSPPPCRQAAVVDGQRPRHGGQDQDSQGEAEPATSERPLSLRGASAAAEVRWAAAAPERRAAWRCPSAAVLQRRSALVTHGLEERARASAASRRRWRFEDLLKT
eukprot:scaffold2210_cov316-Pinguiococcus_pyrenoidosus.AAC.10